MNTLENNKLIAEFLGANGEFTDKNGEVFLNDIPNPEGGKMILRISRLKYHDSWDWLMTAIENISVIIHEYHNNMFEGSDELEKFYDLGLENIKFSEDELTVGTTKEFLYEDVVTFVNWFNLQNS